MKAASLASLHNLATLHKKMGAAVFCAVMLVLTNSPIVYGCACCAEPGTWFQETAKSDPEVLAIVGQLSHKLDKTALLYLTAAGLEEVKGISRASETYTLRRIPPYTRDWRLEFTDQQGNRGTLTFTIPNTAVFFGTDPRDGQQRGAGGPLLYKEWRFEGPVSGTGIFKGGTTARTKFRFILQGRGNMCPAAEDFKSWVLQVEGQQANFAFSGVLNQPASSSGGSVISSHYRDD